MITVPTAAYATGLALLANVSAFVCAAVTVEVAGFDVTPLPAAVAVFVIEPASMSACVIVCVEAQLVAAPGASGPLPHPVIVPCLSSVIANGPASVSVPAFVIV